LVSLPQQLQRVEHLIVLPEVLLELQVAARICGYDDVGVQRAHAARFASTQLMGHIGLQDIVGSRRAAAEVVGWEFDELEFGYRSQTLHGLRARLLTMNQMTGIVVDRSTRNRTELHL
jgi:hypothetical protein